MNDSIDVAVKALSDLALDLGVKVDANQVAQLAGFVIAIFSGEKWKDVAAAGVARAAKVTDQTSAEAAAVERNK